MRELTIDGMRYATQKRRLELRASGGLLDTAEEAETVEVEVIHLDAEPEPEPMDTSEPPDDCSGGVDGFVELTTRPLGNFLL